MKSHFSLLAPGVLLAVLTLILAACGGAPSTPVPTTAPTKAATTAPVQPTSAPATATTVPPSATAVPPTTTLAPTAPAPTDTPAVSESGPTASAQSGYNGKWEGTSSTDSPIQFTVENNQITYLTINFSYHSGGCSVGGGTGNAPESTSITGKDLAAQFTDSDGVVYSIAGSFTSDTEATGSLEVKGKTFCGDTDAKATWKATKTPAESTSGAAETPTAESASGEADTPTTVAEEASPTVESSSSDDPKNVLALFFLGIDTKQIDDALSVVSDDVVFQIGPTNGIGKVELKTFLEDQVSKGVVYAGSNITATGNVVTFSVQATGGASATYQSSSIVVEQGKITVLTMQ